MKSPEKKPFRAFNGIYDVLSREGYSEELIGAAINSCSTARTQQGKSVCVTIEMVRKRLTQKEPLTETPPCFSQPAAAVGNSPQEPPVITDVEERIDRIMAKAEAWIAENAVYLNAQREVLCRCQTGWERMDN